MDGQGDGKMETRGREHGKIEPSITVEHKVCTCSSAQFNGHERPSGISNMQEIQ